MAYSLHNTHAINISMEYITDLIEKSSEPEKIRRNFNNYIYNFLFSQYGTMHTLQWYTYIISKVSKYYFENYVFLNN